MSEKVVSTIKTISIEAIDKAKSGHPGIALSSACSLNTLYTKFINVTSMNPKWFNRDRFILAAGHGSSILYTILHLANFNISIEDIKNLRQLNSITPGHPEVETPGVDATSGPLGQGIAEGIGMQIAESYLASKFNKSDLVLVDHYTYVLCGDGDLQEGVTLEAISLAGHLNIQKLIVLYDSNDVQLDGYVEEVNTENTKLKFISCGWKYIKVDNGENSLEIERAINKAKKENGPVIIEIKNKIGKGSSLEGNPKSHGAPLPSDDVIKFREELGGEKFEICSEVYQEYKDTLIRRGNAKYKKWLKTLKIYASKYPNDYKEFLNVLENKPIVDFDNLIKFDKTYNKATRFASGDIFKAISRIDPYFIGGAADLSSSTQGEIEGGRYTKDNRGGRNIYFGVREHAMNAIANGIALHQGLRVFISGFFVFSDYMKPAMRLSALMKLPLIYHFSHDSIAVGEDGPTHQPVEQISMLRCIPNFNVIRPCDANETIEAFKVAYNSTKTPTCIVCTRQGVRNLDIEHKNLSKGAYIVKRETEELKLIIITAGSETALVLDSLELLENKSIRVVNMPSSYLFDLTSDKYKESILPKNVRKRMVVEMSDCLPYYKYLGMDGYVYGVNTFGKSANIDVIIKEFGFSKDQLLKVIIKYLNKED